MYMEGFLCGEGVSGGVCEYGDVYVQEYVYVGYVWGCVCGDVG